jgi:hypothetical protein
MPRSRSHAVVPRRGGRSRRRCRAIGDERAHALTSAASMNAETCSASARLVGDDPAVTEEQHAVGVRGGDRVVRHHRDGLPVLPARGGEKSQHFAARAGVEVAGRLVGEDEVGAVARARAIATRCC